MRVRVFLTTFHDRGEGLVVERSVGVPQYAATEDNRATLLETVFANGQNEVQPRVGFRSVSVGDVIDLRLAGLGAWRVASQGFVRLGDDEEPDALTGTAAVEAAWGVDRGHRS